jgi:hypothetical protein
MGRLVTAGAETGDGPTEGVSLTASTVAASISTANPRSGTRHFRGGPTLSNSYVRYVITPTTNVTYFYRAYVYMPSNPSTGSTIALIRILNSGVLQQSLLLTNNGTTIGALPNSVPATYGAWLRLEVSMVWNGAAATYAARVDGTTVTLTSASTAAAPGVIDVGWATSPNVSLAIDVDDIALNDDQGASQNTWPGEGKEVLLLPVTDSATGTGWTLGTGTAPGGAGHTALANTPPQGVADLAAGSDPKQMRNASANANVNVDMTMTTYTAAGIAAIDTINVIDPITATGAPVVTSAKAGTVGVVSNPAIANVALGAGGTAGAFWSGVTAGTYPTGWKVSHGTVTYAPSVTLGTAPVMRVTQVTSSTRIAMVCFMGMYVDYTPGVPAQVPYVNPMPPILAQ